MIDAERMLGSLVRNALGGGRRRGRRRRSILGVGRGTLGLGALGVAIAAFEHLAQSKSTPGGQAATSAPLPPLPVPPAAAPGGGAEVLPPLPVATPESPGGAGEALLLVRAMIAAANADHEVDAEESRRILEALDESGASDEERRFVLAELESPLGLAELAAEARTPELARQVYLASRMAVRVDTGAESNYLARLAARLGLDEGRVRELESLIAAEEPA